MIKPGKSARARRQRSGVPGKLGIVRLWGAAVGKLRNDCFERDQFKCQECGRGVSPHTFEGAQDHADMAHIIGRGAGGSDTLDNVRTLCHECHMIEHTQGRKSASD